LIGLTEATVSHHLRQLAEAGIVDKHREGARVLYRLDVTAVKALATVLDVSCDCSGLEPL
jgi:DNA-binding transcriptional ArsR family regulator